MLAGAGRAGVDGPRIIVARLAFIAFEPDHAEAAEGRRIERVAERNKRASVAGRGGADEECASGRDVALGEGDESLGAEPARFVDRYRQRRAKAADGLLVDGLFAQRSRELVDSGLVDRLSRNRRRRSLTIAARGLTKIGSSTAALTCMADGSRRGQAASTSMPAMTTARTLDRAFQEIASVRLPIASGRASASGLHKVDPNPRRLAKWPRRPPTWLKP